MYETKYITPGDISEWPDHDRAAANVSLDKYGMVFIDSNGRPAGDLHKMEEFYRTRYGEILGRMEDSQLDFCVNLSEIYGGQKLYALLGRYLAAVSYYCDWTKGEKAWCPVVFHETGQVRGNPGIQNPQETP